MDKNGFVAQQSNTNISVYRLQEQAQVVISIGAFAALTSSILGGLIYLPRIYFTMARDGSTYNANLGLERV